ncbi:MAG: hypothetical protein WCG87_05820 [Bacteroidota bacterium]
MKYVICSLLLCVGMSVAMAQDAPIYNSSGRDIGKEKRKHVEKGFDPSKLVFGGGGGLSFGDVTQVSLAPLIGYRFSDEFVAGIGLGYEYLRINNYYPLVNMTTQQYDYFPLVSQIFAPSLWAKYLIWNHIYAAGKFEYDIMSYKEYYNDGYTGA